MTQRGHGRDYTGSIDVILDVLSVYIVTYELLAVVLNFVFRHYIVLNTMSMYNVHCLAGGAGGRLEHCPKRLLRCGFHYHHRFLELVHCYIWGAGDRLEYRHQAGLLHEVHCHRGHCVHVHRHTEGSRLEHRPNTGLI